MVERTAEMIQRKQCEKGVDRGRTNELSNEKDDGKAAEKTVNEGGGQGKGRKRSWRWRAAVRQGRQTMASKFKHIHDGKQSLVEQIQAHT